MGFLKPHKMLAIILATLFMVYSIPSVTAQARLRATQPQLQALFIKKITKYVLRPDERRISAIRPVTVAAIRPRPMARFLTDRMDSDLPDGLLQTVMFFL